MTNLQREKRRGASDGTDTRHAIQRSIGYAPNTHGLSPQAEA